MLMIAYESRAWVQPDFSGRYIGKWSYGRGVSSEPISDDLFALFGSASTMLFGGVRKAFYALCPVQHELAGSPHVLVGKCEPFALAGGTTR